MNVHDLLRRYSIQSPVIYEKNVTGSGLNSSVYLLIPFLKSKRTIIPSRWSPLMCSKRLPSAKSRRRLKKLVRMLCVSRLNDHKKSRNFKVKLRLFLCGVLFGFVLWICPFCVIHERCRHPRDHKLGHVCRDKDVPPNVPFHSPECDDTERERINQL